MIAKHSLKGEVCEYYNITSGNLSGLYMKNECISKYAFVPLESVRGHIHHVRWRFHRLFHNIIARL